MANDRLQAKLALDKAYRYLHQGRHLNADIEARKCLKQRPKDPAVQRLLGLIASARGDYKEAARYLKVCMTACPKEPLYASDLAQVRVAEGRYQEAITLYERALTLRPDWMETHASKADVMERSGDLEGAKSIVAPHVDAGTETGGMAVVMSRIEMAAGNFQYVVDLANRHIDREDADPVSRRLLLGHAAKAHQRLGDPEAAFRCYEEANKFMAVPFDTEEYERYQTGIIELFSAQNMPKLVQSKMTSQLPVFIACMPRSGSTLVEQIIHAHPQAFGAGELSHFGEIVRNMQMLIESFQIYPACMADVTLADANRLGKSYLDDLKKMDRQAKRITNKALDNWRHLAVAQLLLPGARVVHIQREAMDNCFSCFIAALQPQHVPWANDLRNLGFVYRQYERMMQHWREVLDIPILDVQYEALVEDSEYWVRKIIEFCGLEWDDACLRHQEAKRNVLTISYDQVRKPIYKSAVKRYEKYEPWLGPLREALGLEPWAGPAGANSDGISPRSEPS